MEPIDNLRQLSLHPEYPDKAWIVIEQPPGELFRIQFNPVNNSFERTVLRSLVYERGFSGAYGWIGGTGLPPAPHFDVLLFTRLDLKPGDIIPGHICGVFLHNSGDHKFVALDDVHLAFFGTNDLHGLPPDTQSELFGVYPRVGADEGWYGCPFARDFLVHNQPSHD